MLLKYSNFEVQTKKILIPIPYKDTDIFSEIGKFFNEKDATSAMNTITDMTGIEVVPIGHRDETLK